VAGRGTTATAALERAQIPFTVHEYAHDPRAASYGREASEALGVSADRVFKTLIAAVDGDLVAGVVPVEGQLDLKALAAAVGGKRGAMADVAAAERATGYVAGGISPSASANGCPWWWTRRRWRSARCSAAADGGGWRSNSRPVTWSGPQTRRWPASAH
jgi:Cys-tRNA(Pro) deacylase